MPRHMGWSRALPQQRAIEAKRDIRVTRHVGRVLKCQGLVTASPMATPMVATHWTSSEAWQRTASLRAVLGFRTCRGRIFQGDTIVNTSVESWQSPSFREVQCWLRAGIGQLCPRAGLSLHRGGNHWGPSRSPELCFFAAFETTLLNVVAG